MERKKDRMKENTEVLSRFANVLLLFFSCLSPSLHSAQCSYNGLNVHGIDNNKQTESNVLKMKVTGMPTLKAPKKKHLTLFMNGPTENGFTFALSSIIPFTFI